MVMLVIQCVNLDSTFRAKLCFLEVPEELDWCLKRSFVGVLHVISMLNCGDRSNSEI